MESPNENHNLTISSTPGRPLYGGARPQRLDGLFIKLAPSFVDDDSGPSPTYSARSIIDAFVRSVLVSTTVTIGDTAVIALVAGCYGWLIVHNRSDMRCDAVFHQRPTERRRHLRPPATTTQVGQSAATIAP